ncbi:MAG: glutamate--tRNA ligase [Patescibacteria group bacterium]|nr:glutamate--tRNA ligase [Patescibacteria group bacterium]
MTGQKKIRTRFAPSPTGYLHIGSLRTALFDYLFARKYGGDFVLRIEDTDRQRLVPGAVENLIKILQEFGLKPDEGPHKPDPKYAPYVQSERLPLYNKYAKTLVERQMAYYCFCATERLENLRKQQEAQKQPPHYDGFCRDLSATDVQAKLAQNAEYVIRQRIPKTGVTEYDDLVYGHLQFKNELLDDSILVKSDGYPVYNFANVVDDHLMEITHVIRGEEFLSSTPKHVLLYKAFGWTQPVFFHLPLILDEKRQKLSKRSGDVAVEEYLKKGYLKEAILNFISLLGWNPKTADEIFSLSELVERFEVEKVNKPGAIFDVRKLDFIDRQWRKRLNLKSDDDPLFRRAQTLLKDFPGNRKVLELVYPQILERIAGPSDLEERMAEFNFYFKEPRYDASLLLWKKLPSAQAKLNLQKLKRFLAGLKPEDFIATALEAKLKAFIAEQGMATGEALWPLRVALSGQKNSPGPFEILEVFAKSPAGIKIALNRIDKAISMLSDISKD